MPSEKNVTPQADVLRDQQTARLQQDEENLRDEVGAVENDIQPGEPNDSRTSEDTRSFGERIKGEPVHLNDDLDRGLDLPEGKAIAGFDEDKAYGEETGGLSVNPEDTVRMRDERGELDTGEGQLTEMEEYNNGFARAIENIANVLGDSPVADMLHNIAHSIEERYGDDTAVSSDKEVDISKEANKPENVRDKMEREIDERAGVVDEQDKAKDLTVQISDMSKSIKEKGTLGSDFEKAVTDGVTKYPVRTGRMINDFAENAKEQIGIAYEKGSPEYEASMSDLKDVTGYMTGVYYEKLKVMEENGVRFTDEEKWMIDEQKPADVDVKYSDYEKGKSFVSDKDVSDKQLDDGKLKEAESGVEDASEKKAEQRNLSNVKGVPEDKDNPDDGFDLDGLDDEGDFGEIADKVMSEPDVPSKPDKPARQQPRSRMTRIPLPASENKPDLGADKGLEL